MPVELLIVGIIIVIGGISIILNPTFYSTTYSTTFDFSGIKWPLGLIFILIGSYCIFQFTKRQRPENKFDNWICPSCEDVSKLIGSIDHKCEKCFVPLEKLNGFYERKDKLINRKDI